MTSTTQISQITLPITPAMQQTAAQFAQRQPATKAEQVRLNTLAVCAVNQYCQMMSIPTEIAAADSWNPVMQMAANVADLELTGVGRLECRPVGLNETTCFVPAEVWDNRVGYLAVQLNEPELEFTLLGFVPTVMTEDLPLNQLRSIEAFLDWVHTIRTATSPVQPNHALTHLGQWFSRQWLSRQAVSEQAGWQTVETLLSLLNPAPEFAFRQAALEDTLTPTDRLTDLPDSTEHSIRRAKLLHLSTPEIDYPLALVIELIPRDDQRRSVYVQVHTIEPGVYLPAGLQLIASDQNGDTLLETQARQTDDYIQLRLRGEVNEIFTLQISLEDTALIERFMI